ncbi:hypothetical protein M0813_07762 [Anaeramoeba flamelloides]|uniref:Uncharacterized protein n=1 Tax=Anaeramoeba flamelloides TaxID=1746091 RepID=A0ABQ8XD26_9EUKA|nr:hypothetical protein M0813_07762 [Anaeramoeba flamelloides]
MVVKMICVFIVSLKIDESQFPRLRKVRLFAITKSVAGIIKKHLAFVGSNDFLICRRGWSDRKLSTNEKINEMSNFSISITKIPNVGLYGYSPSFWVALKRNSLEDPKSIKKNKRDNLKIVEQD